ncbi:MAG: outer membrane lipid asymmetry maintenance protein MlaD [Alphaproteobacteria bacterium]|jgi:phospholipid/cholesterol/gamma-HCH transport system substrate-binding protein|nr:outer membrane lipid asymmetry maintenance protein MlaD [Rhodospirillaceae bacterium]MBT6202802.1 outer membrane lipid asymmetry maintenance protein MlaD [Rhodospirillaceae bacterium]MBT7614992.1 outer membrane lipid asymmetry maintenance protein MlaD [Rhodospirillaceae bacterium]MDG2481808.1 outer membrane lipid asymmetry maintenance protein MlaD [Alphaproteobacteria bacterium]
MGAKTLETLVGAVVVIVAVCFFIFAYNKADVAGVKGYSVRAEFNSIGGLKSGDDVRIAGIKVGTVSGMELDPDWYSAIVSMNIDDKISLSQDTFVSISSESLLGGNYVSMQPGGSADLAQDGYIFQHTQGAVDLMDVISRAMFGGVSN